MRICLVGDNSSVHVQKWVSGIASQKNVELHVLSFNLEVQFSGVSYHQLTNYLGNKLDYILNTWRVRQLVKEINPDLVHSHYATSNGLMGALSGFHPYVITGWGSDIFDSPRNFFMRQMLRYSFRKADAITVLTEIALKEVSKLTDKKVKLVHFGVDLEKFRKRESPYRQKGSLRIGSIRTLSSKYGVEDLLRAFAILVKSVPGLHLDIVGDGPQRKYLESLVKESGTTNQITFHGYISQTTESEKYLDLLNSFDVFVIPSVLDSETFGVAAVEASACSIPVVGTNVGGLPGVIDHMQTGLIVPKQNPEELASALHQILSNAKLRQEMGTKGRQKCERLYNWDDNLTSMMKVYRDVIKAG